jgi:hypothetical protein
MVISENFLVDIQQLLVATIRGNRAKGPLIVD